MSRKIAATPHVYLPHAHFFLFSFNNMIILKKQNGMQEENIMFYYDAKLTNNVPISCCYLGFDQLAKHILL